MYHIFSTIPVNGKSEFVADLIVCDYLFVATLSHKFVNEKLVWGIENRIYFWHFDRLEIKDGNDQELINTLFPDDLFDMEFLSNDENLGSEY